MIDLNLLYQSALTGIQRAHVFMRFGAQGVSVCDFDGTRLPGRKDLSIVPEPMPQEVLDSYLAQFRAWVVGMGLRELVETYCQFLDEVYGHGLAILSPPDHERLQRTFEQASLREKVRRLRQEMGIDGGFSEHFETLTAARNALTHGTGTVRARDCTDGNELVITWRGLEVYFTGEDGVRYRVGGEPREMQLREPLETITVDRQRRWARGEKVELSAYDLAEITFMANHEAMDVLDSLREFGLRHGVITNAAIMIRGR
jgi:hypothetical protein